MFKRILSRFFGIMRSKKYYKQYSQSDFELLINELKESYVHFCLNQHGHRSVGGNVYGNHIFIWNSVLRSSEYTYWIGLAKFFDKSTFKDKISIYNFRVNNFSNDEADLIKKLKKLRDKWLAHHNIKALKDFAGFLSEIGFKPQDNEKLFEIAISKTMDVGKIFNMAENFQNSFQQINTTVKGEINNWLKGFNCRNN